MKIHGTITRRTLTVWPLLLLVLCSAQYAFAQTRYAVNAGTVIRVRLDDSLSSKTAKKGDFFSSNVVEPVYSNGGVLVIPAGSTVRGKVTAVSPAEKDGRPGSIDVAFTSITLPNKRRVTIVGTLSSLDEDDTKSDEEGTATAKKTSNRNLKFIGGGATGGAILGGAIGGGKGAAIGAGVGALAGLIGKNASKGREAEVKSGTQFGVYLERRITLPRY